MKNGLTVTRIAELFYTTRQTVHRWLIRGRHVGREPFKDRHRESKACNVSDKVELSILTLENVWVVNSSHTAGLV